MRKTMTPLLFAFLLVLAVSAEAVQKADLVIVNKEQRQLILMGGGAEIKRYRVSLGGSPKGHKRQEGDQKTPEGHYVLDYKKPDSSFYKAIHISYPNEEDKKQARIRGVSAGGFIMIHGQKNGLGLLGRIMQRTDWTDGCIAVKNSEMEEIWRLVDAGTPIQINP